MKKSRMKLLANLITLSRVIGAILIPFIYIEYGGVITVIVTIFIFMTDAVDGYIARKYQVSTFFGAYLDTFCDKFLALFTLSALILKTWIVIIPIILELVIVITQIINYQSNKVVATNFIGKVKTVFLAIAIINGLVLGEIYSGNELNFMISINFLIVFIFQIITILSYLYQDSFKDINLKIAQVLKMDIKNKSKKTIIKDKSKYCHKNLKEIIKDFYSEEFYKNNQDVSLKELLLKPKK